MPFIDCMKSKLVESQTIRQKSIENGKQQVIGVNCYTEGEDSPLTNVNDGGFMKVDEKAEKKQIAEVIKFKSNAKEMSLEESMPKLFKELKKNLLSLEKYYKDMQDVEFTIENGKLWILQTRSGKRTSKSAVKIAVDMVKEKLISKKQAIMRIEPSSLDTLLHPTLDEKSKIEVIANGLPASPGAASGRVVFSSDEAERFNDMMQNTILVRIETSPEDIHGMHAAKGILTSRGGMTSHAAVVARGMGRPCVSGSSEIEIDYSKKIFKTKNYEIKEGDVITIDGSTGRIILGEVRTIKPEMLSLIHI